jgi:hypothetical protein
VKHKHFLGITLANAAECLRPVTIVVTGDFEGDGPAYRQSLLSAAELLHEARIELVGSCADNLFPQLPQLDPASGLFFLNNGPDEMNGWLRPLAAGYVHAPCGCHGEELAVGRGLTGHPRLADIFERLDTALDLCHSRVMEQLLKVLRLRQAPTEAKSRWTQRIKVSLFLLEEAPHLGRFFRDAAAAAYCSACAEQGAEPAEEMPAPAERNIRALERFQVDREAIGVIHGAILASRQYVAAVAPFASGLVSLEQNCATVGDIISVYERAWRRWRM